MGREARVKAERRAHARAAAWGQGVPTIVNVPAEQYTALRGAMQDTLKVEQMIAQLRIKTRERRADIMRLAGLDPSRSYRLRDDTMTAELVVE